MAKTISAFPSSDNNDKTPDNTIKNSTGIKPVLFSYMIRTNKITFSYTSYR